MSDDMMNVSWAACEALPLIFPFLSSEERHRTFEVLTGRLSESHIMSLQDIQNLQGAALGKIFSYLEANDQAIALGMIYQGRSRLFSPGWNEEDPLYVHPWMVQALAHLFPKLDAVRQTEFLKWLEGDGINLPKLDSSDQTTRKSAVNALGIVFPHLVNERKNKALTWLLHTSLDYEDANLTLVKVFSALSFADQQKVINRFFFVLESDSPHPYAMDAIAWLYPNLDSSHRFLIERWIFETETGLRSKNTTTQDLSRLLSLRIVSDLKPAYQKEVLNWILTPGTGFEENKYPLGRMAIAAYLKTQESLIVNRGRALANALSRGLEEPVLESEGARWRISSKSEPTVFPKSLPESLEDAANWLLPDDFPDEFRPRGGENVGNAYRNGGTIQLIPGDGAFRNLGVGT